MGDPPLFYELDGNGPPLVLIHSGGFDRRLWDDQCPAFAGHYRVIRYDVRGHGRSPLPTKPYSDAEDLYRLLTTLEVERAHLMGLSLGGRIAIDFTLAHPAMVESLILAAPDVSGYAFSAEHVLGWIKIVTSIEHDDGTPAGDLWLASHYLAPAMEHPAIAAKLRPIARDNARFWLIHPLLARDLFAVPPATLRLGEIQVPTLLVVGDRHTADVHNMVRLVEQGIPGVRKVMIPGPGHLVNVEKPEEFNRAVREFLRGRRDGEPHA
jgi:pimeloyl-ACP methyl ester carboxylesterase